jgi:putative component of membrane protein insertase Oxa1/YidC/SpoIIIJ protein YidD
MPLIVKNSNPNREKFMQARDYCLYHSLSRPSTNFKTGLIWFVVLELLVLAIAFVVSFLFGKLKLTVSFYYLYLLSSVLVYCIYLKKICVLAIEIYQHYASDETRRRCSLMPSCSEYALLSLQKYNVFKALYKIFTRLNSRCNGIYKIDFP